MIVLTETTDTIKAALGAAHTTNALPCVVSFRDLTATLFVPGRTVLFTNGATAITLKTAPTASHTLEIDYISIFNADTITHTVTVYFDANGTTYNLWKGKLAAGYSVRYQHKKGWEVSGDAGAILLRENAHLEDVQIFTATGSGTWTKPTGFTPSIVLVQCVGGGGGGGGGDYSNPSGGQGGGGGAFVEKLLRAADLGATESVSVGTGGSAGVGGESGGEGTSGGDGGASSFGTTVLVKAFGGAGGGQPAGSGGGGGGTGSAGFGETPGGPLWYVEGDDQPFPTGFELYTAVGGSGAAGGTNSWDTIQHTGGYAQEGGGGGGAGPSFEGGEGGTSWRGGGGGGCGGSYDGETLYEGLAGGASGAFSTTGGGGGTGATASSGTGGNGDAGNSWKSGSGGGGGGGGGSATAGNGGAGGAPGGGGGGGGTGNSQIGGNGGAGGRGEVRVYSW